MITAGNPTSVALPGKNVLSSNALRLNYTSDGGYGNSASVYTFDYPGGSLESEATVDEGGHQVRAVAYTLGQEGDEDGVSGSTEPATYTYDGLYRLISLADGKNNITNYYYNQQGYLAGVTYPGYNGLAPSNATGSWTNISGNDTVQYPSYDKDGNVLTRIDGRGVTTNYTYNDPESKLTGVSYSVPSGSAIPSQRSVSLGYDGFGRLDAINNFVTQINWNSQGSSPGYDDDDNPLNVNTRFYSSVGAPLFNKTVAYTYYADGSKATATVPSGTFTYDYDGAGRPSSLTNPIGETTTWNYLANNWLSGQILANGATTAYAYDAKANVAQLTNRDGTGSILSNFTGMTYDAAGNRQSLTASVPSDATYTGTTSYAYDSKNELKTEQSTRNGNYTNSFQYDAAENPTTFRGATIPGYNADNQTTAANYAYDGNGNPTDYGETPLTFDAENRLTAYGGQLTAGYGADDLRAWKTDSSGTTYYLYTDDSTLPVCEMNSSGNVTATNTFGPNGLISRNAANGSTFYEFDPQGSVSERLSSSGSCFNHSMADAFGFVATSNYQNDPFGFGAAAGYLTDQATGLVVTANRYYDPATGRFLNRDPIVYEGGIDLYGYCTNNPVNVADPSGDGPFQIQWPPWFRLIIGALGGGGAHGEHGVVSYHPGRPTKPFEPPSGPPPSGVHAQKPPVTKSPFRSNTGPVGTQSSSGTRPCKTSGASGGGKGSGEPVEEPGKVGIVPPTVPEPTDPNDPGVGE